MENKEKYAKEIVEIACSGSEIAMNTTTMKLAACFSIDCENCYFSKYNYPHDQGDCTKNLIHWANSDCAFSEEEVLKMFDEFEDKLGIDKTPNYTVKIGGKYVKSLDYSKEEGWTYETSDEPVWMSKINAECVITDVIEFIDNIPNENEVTFEVKK